MRPKLNPEGTSVLEFIAQIADAKKKEPHKSIEDIATDLYGPNMVDTDERQNLLT